MALCKGCQEFRRYMFMLIDEFSEEEVRIPLHKSFAELSECADSHCDLCKYFRRERCFQRDLKTRECSREEDIIGQDREINIILRQETTNRSQKWKFENLGIGVPYWRWAYLGNHASFTKEIRPQVAGIEQLVDMSRRWLATCQNKHSCCNGQATQHSEFLPTRLLDVRTPEQYTIQLVSCEALSKASSIAYLTLSYCWGNGNDAACTTRANLEERSEGFPVSSLPRTVQDAIVLTRAFGARYVWIDALCIIEDENDSEGWQRELLNMGRIYRNSLFTIAASSAPDSSMGFLTRRVGIQWPVQDYLLSRNDDPDTGDGCFLLGAALPEWVDSVEDSILSTRGWVLQERMLATRTLFWTDVGIFWECSQLRCSEYRDVYGILSGSPRELQLSILVEDIRDHELLNKEREYNTRPLLSRGLWAVLLQHFSERALTNVTDKLPAVTGLGQELARLLTRSEFETGVFKHNLVHELAWVTGFKKPTFGGHKTIAEQQTVRVPGTPSWCWASAHQPLHFRPSRNAIQFQEHAIDVRLSEQRIQARSRLGSLQLKTLDKESIHLTSTYLSISLPNRPYTFRPSRSCVEAPFDYKDEVYGGIYDEIASFDTLSEALPKEGGTITCVQWLSWAGGNRLLMGELMHVIVTGAIIIAPTEEGSNVYRRIGWLEVWNDDFFDEEPQILYWSEQDLSA